MITIINWWQQVFLAVCLFSSHFDPSRRKMTSSEQMSKQFYSWRQSSHLFFLSFFFFPCLTFELSLGISFSHSLSLTLSLVLLLNPLTDVYILSYLAKFDDVTTTYCLTNLRNHNHFFFNENKWRREIIFFSLTLSRLYPKEFVCGCFRYFFAKLQNWVFT